MPAASNRNVGSVYLHVLASSLLVSVIGAASIAAVRLQMRSCRLARDYAEARACAVSAVELGLLHVTNPNWRTTWPNGTWMEDQPLGAGRFTLQGTDPQDSDLADSPYDALILTGIGARGTTRHKTQVVLVPAIESFDALNTCLHASGLIYIEAGKKITAVGAPVSTNGQFNNDGTLDGSAEAASVNHVGVVKGTLTVPAPAKALPAATVISRYADNATVVPYTGTIDKAVLGPACNPWGPTDPNGLYLIDTGGNDLTIKNTRIYGTLVVRLGSKTLILDSAVFLHNYRADFPVLLVDGNLTVRYTSATTTLSETSLATNFNPVGSPYEGIWDTDTLDQYPNEVRGLVHVDGSVYLQQTARVVGAIICEGAIYGEENNTIIHDPVLYACPPRHYTHVAGMKISPDSWKQVVD